MDLGRYYDLEFVTSSLVKKAEAAAFTATTGEIHDDSTCPEDSSSASESESGKSGNSNKKRLNSRPSAAYQIAASAATFVHSRAKDLLFHGSETQQEDIDMTLESNERESLHKEERSMPRVYRSDAGSEVAAYVTASTMTAVVAAGDKEKEEAATALQTLQSSPCEWFVCDDSSIYTRCFVIQVTTINCIVFPKSSSCKKNKTYFATAATNIFHQIFYQFCYFSLNFRGQIH